MTKISFFERAYINLPTSYIGLEHLDFMPLIHAVAKANPEGDGDIPLYNTATHEIFEKRTKIFLVKKTRRYILGMPERFCENENMATFVSLRQLQNLIKAFNKDKKRISCYGLIYIYVIYTLLPTQSTEASACMEYLSALYNLIHRYLESNPDDELAVFFDGCYNPIGDAIKAKNIMLNNNQLPFIPRNHPQEDE